MRLSEKGGCRIGGATPGCVRARPDSLAARVRALLAGGFTGTALDVCATLKDAEIKGVRRALDVMHRRGELVIAGSVRAGYVWKIKAMNGGGGPSV